VIVVPFVEGMLHPRVVPAIEAQGYTPMLKELPREGARYPRLLLELFAAWEDFTVIEQDIESRPGFLDGLRDCPESWCFHAYPLSVPFNETNLPYAPLGHTRFRAGLWHLVSDLVFDERWLETWVARDAYLGWHLLGKGLKPHRHGGDALHLRSYDERHPSADWEEIQDKRLRADDPVFPMFTFKCERCNVVLRTERSSTIRKETDHEVSASMCPICTGETSLWADWHADI
jgi:hypothetical protein